MNRHILAEMTVIILLAAALGITWNRRLLFNAWTGRAPAVAQESAQPTASIPLPLGLMQVKELYDQREALFVDARDEKSFASGHVKGALSLPVGELAARLPRFIAVVPLTRTVVAYCNGYDCRDSRELGEGLLRAGFRTVYLFEGGYPEWRDAGYPTERGTQ